MTLRERFEKFHAENPKVWKLWVRFALEAINAGHKTLSASLIAERIRWETSVVTTGDRFKLNNNHRAYYARMFMERFPTLPRFSTRELHI